MPAHTKDITDLIKEFRANPEFGLTDGQAKENAVTYGRNAFEPAKKENLFKRILSAASDRMILLLIIAGIIALAVNIVREVLDGEAEFLEVAGIFAVIALSVAITVVMEGRSAKAFEALNKLGDDIAIKALRDGQPVLLSQKDIVAGDILLLSTGDKIPADGRLLLSEGLAADESALTGESVPAKKDAECLITDEVTPVAERRNMLYSGTFITGGFCRLLVTAVGDRTEFGKIARLLGDSKKTTTPLQERLGRLGKLITVFGVLAAAAVFIAQLISFALHDGLHLKTVTEAFITSIVLIVAVVPEGLPTIVAVSLSINIIKLSRKNALVKKMIASETVGCINVICSDKTGTLTENKMTVVGGITHKAVLRNICLNSTADIGADGAFIGNPTECALLTAAEKSGEDYRVRRRDAEIAHVFTFSSDKKAMTTLVRDGGGFTAYMKGSPEKILRACIMDARERKKLESEIEAHQKKSCRIIAFCHRTFAQMPALDEVAIECGMTFDGYAAISDPLRADVSEAVSQCRKAGIDIKMLTGDNLVTATAIAEELGILGGGRIAVEAREIEPLDDKALSEMLPKIGVIARSTPTIKMRVVCLLKDAGNVVAVTGDGINDAPALKHADVGIAMGIAGTEVSKEAGDIVLLDDSFSTIVNAVGWGRGIYENFKRFITFQLTANIASVIIVLTSVMLGIFMSGFNAPFTALQLLWINIVMDGPTALTLGLEPIRNDLMNRPPVKRNENILSKPLFIRVVATAAVISAVIMTQYAFNFLGTSSSDQTLTALFALFATLLLFNAFNCRELRGKSIFRNLLKNRLMLIAVGATLIAQILIIQFAGAFFGTVPLPFLMWLKIFAVAVGIVVLFEIVNAMMRLVKRPTEKVS
ncbi:MAG: calcium-translocating P-type ATPase, PMCA-type [Firmicutes bacterium]|nr:calcium-translocating P-type ATPase, PMCA-type [Bacillota bacterium]